MAAPQPVERPSPHSRPWQPWHGSEEGSLEGRQETISLKELNHGHHTTDTSKTSYTEAPSNPVRSPLLPKPEGKVNSDAVLGVIFTKAV